MAHEPFRCSLVSRSPLVVTGFENAKIMGESTSQELQVQLLPGQTMMAASHTVTHSTGGVERNSTWTSGIDRWSHNGSKDTAAASLTLSNVFGNESTPCTIEQLNLQDHGNEILCEFGGFLCASDQVQVKNTWQRLPSIRWSFHKLTGDGTVFLRGNGIQRLHLTEGESVSMCSEKLVAISRDTQAEASQLKTPWCSFVPHKVAVTLTGPGTVWQQESLSLWQVESGRF